MATESEHRTWRVELELAAGQEPIRGQLRDARGAEAPFTGWLERIQIIDQVRTSPPSTARPRTES